MLSQKLMADKLNLLHRTKNRKVGKRTKNISLGCFATSAVRTG